MADALISPAVGGAMWAASAGIVGWCCRREEGALAQRTVPLMGVMGAFTFAAQMINFAVPGTGSSGHLGGGVLLAVLLGPRAALLTMVSVLTVQALFFADGGLLALGCNIFNLGVIPAFIAYPLIYRPLTTGRPSPRRTATAAFLTAVFALQLGAFAVVLETALSGISALPILPFALLMQPIHLAIGIVEGAATVAVIRFMLRARPDLLSHSTTGAGPNRRSVAAVVGIAVAAVLLGGVFSRLASTQPDGLEWAVAGASDAVEHESERANTAAHRTAAAVQHRTAVLPDYNFRPGAHDGAPGASADIGTSAAGLTGGVLTLFAALAGGWILSRKRRTTGE